MVLIWVAGVIYATIPIFWLIIHPFAGFWRRRQHNPLPSLAFIWAVVIFLGLFITRPWHNHRLYTTPLAWIPAAMLFVSAILVYRRSGHGFGLGTLIGRAELDTNRAQELVTGGIHGRVRHPIYLGHLAMLTSLSLGSGLTVMFALLAFAVITGAFMIRTEDAELEARFGEEFRAYRQRVPAVIPRMH